MKIVFILAALMCSASVSAMTTVTVRKAGALGSLLTQAQQDTCTSLVIKGKLNSADIRVLRRMAGGVESGECVGALSFLDLSGVRMVSCNENYMVLNAAEENLVCAVYAKKLEEHGRYNERQWFNVRKYGAAYALACDSDENYKVVRMAKCYFRDRYVAENGFGRAVEPYERKVASNFYISFCNGLTDREWKFLDSNKMTVFAGHRLKKKGGVCTLYCKTQNGVFSGDFFYKCPRMKTVVLPDKATLDDTIVVWDTPVLYIHKRMQGKITVK